MKFKKTLVMIVTTFLVTCFISNATSIRSEYTVKVLNNIGSKFWILFQGTKVVPNPKNPREDKGIQYRKGPFEIEPEKSKSTKLRAPFLDGGRMYVCMQNPKAAGWKSGQEAPLPSRPAQIVEYTMGLNKKDQTCSVDYDEMLLKVIHKSLNI
jgi:hypothetical protein